MCDVYLNDINDMEIDLYNQSIEYNEFIEAMDILDNLFKDSNEIVLEAVTNQKSNHATVKKIINNTGETIGTVGYIYGGLTDAEGMELKGGFNIVASLAKIFAKIVNWVMRKVGFFAEQISRFLNFISSIPKEIKLKITGDIELYITANDLQGLFNRGLVDQIDNYISAASQFVQGDYWKSVFAHGNIKEGFNNSDGHYYNQMDNIYNYLKKLNFTKTVINMRDRTNHVIYFGDNKSITYTHHGTVVKCNYYNALLNLIKAIKARDKDLEIIRDAAILKVDNAKCNGAYAKALGVQRKKLDKSIELVSGIINVIGKIVKYINMDIKTMNDAFKVVMHQAGVNEANTK
jgi:hypothetical protein